MTPSSRRGFSSPCRVLALCGLTLAALSLPGCSLKGPKLVPPPPVVQKPKFPVFDPTDYITPGVRLPGVYRVTGVTSGELLTIQGVNMVQKGTTMVPEPGVPETVRLAGIVTPAPGTPGWQNTVNKVTAWVGGRQDLEVEVDPKYPVDLQNHRMVQIYFNPTAKSAPAVGSSSARSSSSMPSSSMPSSSMSSSSSGSTGSSSTGLSSMASSYAAAGASGGRWNLNRMLVHTGYAVVDLFGATSIDVQKWLNDEEFAKNYIDPKTNTRKPLGLWALGMSIPQRGIPPRSKGAIMVIPGSTSAIGSTMQGSLQSSQTTQTQQTTGSTIQNGQSSTGTTSGMPSGTSTMPSTVPPAMAPSGTSSTTAASRSTTTRSVTTPSSAATSTTTRSTNSGAVR